MCGAICYLWVIDLRKFYAIRNVTVPFPLQAPQAKLALIDDPSFESEQSLAVTFVKLPNVRNACSAFVLQNGVTTRFGATEKFLQVGQLKFVDITEITTTCECYSFIRTTFGVTHSPDLSMTDSIEQLAYFGFIGFKDHYAPRASECSELTPGPSPRLEG